MELRSTGTETECTECGAETDLQIEFDAAETAVSICRTCLVVLRWHMEQLDTE